MEGCFSELNTIVSEAVILYSSILYSSLLSTCNQHFYLLKQLIYQGLSLSQLHVIFNALTASQLLYALPVWGGCLSAELMNKINGLFRKACKYGYTTELLVVRFAPKRR